MNKRKKLIEWIKAHRKVLIISGISVCALVLFVLGIKNKAKIEAVWSWLKRKTKQTELLMAFEGGTEDVAKSIISSGESSAIAATSAETLTFKVRGHIRVLPAGWHASPEKIAEALSNDIVLAEGQTWVAEYLKGGIAA